TMAWIMDTYSMKVGYACPEIVTGKPVELGGCVGRREATGRGVTYCILEALKDLEIQTSGATAVVRGFGKGGSEVCQELQRRGDGGGAGVRQRRLGGLPGTAPSGRQGDRGRRPLRGHPQPARPGRPRPGPARRGGEAAPRLPAGRADRPRGAADHALHGAGAG